MNSTNPINLRHEFDSSRTCDYCGVPEEKTGLLELCPVRQARHKAKTNLPEETDRDQRIREAESQMRLLLTNWSIQNRLAAAEESRFLANYMASRLNAAVNMERQPC